MSPIGLRRYFIWVFLVTRPFRGYQHLLTLWSWPWRLIFFLKTLTPLITIQQWVIELWYFTWVFLVSDKIFPLVPTIFTLWPRPWSLIYFLENWTVSARVFIFHLIIINCYKTDANYHRSQRVFFNNRCLKIRERYLKKGTYTWISCTGQF